MNYQRKNLINKVAANAAQYQIAFVDLFCGFGGTSKGAEDATVNGQKVACVAACVNHDPVAIECHEGNMPNALHFVEDIRTLDLSEIIYLTNQIRNLWNASGTDGKIYLWASLECTNFSNAKGGQPRCADSRTLAEHLYRYLEVINPDMIWIENVIEFMSWGPLDEKGKPVSRSAGRDYIKWVEHVKSYGYNFDKAVLNSADFGAFTSRKRLFLQFAKPGIEIVWPEPTHSKVVSEDNGIMFGNVKRLQKWKPVREVLDLHITGESIFQRLKNLSDKTYERILAGLIKFVAGGKDNYKQFLINYHHSSVADSIDKPMGTITTRDKKGLVNAEFIVQRNNGNPESKLVDTDGPARTLTTTGGNQELVRPEFLAAYYGSGENVSSVESPAPTIPTKDRCALVKPQFLVRQFKSITNQSINEPGGALLTTPKMDLVTAEPWLMDTQYNASESRNKDLNNPAPTITANRKHHYLMNPQWLNTSPSDVDKPCFTLIARMDKAPPYLVEAESGQIAIEVYETDTPHMVLIKQFMALYGIVDVKMRMLNVSELLRIQGFPDTYYFSPNATQANKKKFIGNSVVPIISQRLTEANYQANFALVEA